MALFLQVEGIPCCQLQPLLFDAFLLLLLLIFLNSKLVVALHRFTSILDIYVLIDKNIYSQLKRFYQRKKPEMNIGKSQRGTVRRNLNSKYSCWIMHMCEK